MSSMRRTAFLMPVLLASAASGSMQSIDLALPGTPSYAVASDIDYSIADWRRLRASDGYAFGDYARFLIANPGWPGEAAMRRAAEKQMRAGESTATVLAFFQTTEPKTGNGYARLAEAMAASGRSVEAAAAARSALAMPDLSATDEASLMQRFASQMTMTDYDRRVDALLIARKPDDAKRMLAWASPAGGVRGANRAP